MRAARAAPSSVTAAHRARSAAISPGSWSISRDYTIAQAATRLDLTPSQIRELVKDERDRRELKKYRLDSTPVTRARAFLEHEFARDPELTLRTAARTRQRPAFLSPAPASRQAARSVAPK